MTEIDEWTDAQQTTQGVTIWRHQRTVLDQTPKTYGVRRGTPSADLYVDYLDWARSHGYPRVSSRAWSRALTRTGFPQELRHDNLAGKAVQFRDLRLLGADGQPVPDTEPERAERVPGLDLDADSLPLPVLVLRDPPAWGVDTPLVPMRVEDTDQLLSTLVGQTVTVDVEHTGYPLGHPDYALRTVQLGNAEWCLVLHPTQHANRIRAMIDQAGAIVAHSATADVIPLAHADLCRSADTWPKVLDTAILAALADPHLTDAWGDDTEALGLKALSRRLLTTPVSDAADKARASLFRSRKWLTNTKPTTPVEKSGWAQVDPGHPVMVAYAGSDVLDTAAVLPIVLASATPDLSRAGNLLVREQWVQQVTARVTEHGLRLDGERIAELDKTHRQRATAAAEVLRDLYDVANPGSTQQLAAAFAGLGVSLPQTEKGNDSTAGEVVDEIAEVEGPGQDLAQVIVRWRVASKLLNAFIEPYASLVEHGDGRVRPTVYTLGAAATGRMSCARPNLQQVPRTGGVRGCIVADPGMTLVSADFAGIELRVAAAVSGDAGLAQMIAEGMDLHSEIAKLVWGEGYTKAHRYAAKRAVFGRIYGAGPTTIAKQLGEFRSAVHQVVDTMDRLTPGLRRWSDELRTRVRNGWLPYWQHPSGRRTYLPRDTPHKCPNYVIQSTAREVLVDALVAWEQTKWGGSMLLPVHDELVVQVPEGDAERATQVLVRCMTSTLDLGTGVTVPVAAEASEPSTRWRDST